MADLSARSMARCAGCGKLIKLEPDETLCASCFGDACRDAGEETAQPFADLGPESTCTRCKLRRCLPDSEFCLNCQIEIVADLGDTAQELIVKMETIEDEPSEHLSTYETYRAKRRRTPTSHINVVGGQPLKWWRQG